jgi:hypothetical protein
VGFIDGTFMAFARPEDQQAWYSGHKKSCGAKFQGIVTPDGLISSFMGEWKGTVNDITMLHTSGIQEKLRAICEGVRTLYLYGDSAYGYEYGIWSPYQHRFGRQWLSANQRKLNQEMSSFRIGVEHSFGLQQNLWGFNSYNKQLCSGKLPVTAYAYSAILLTNIWSCIRGGNQISDRYRLIEPPLVEDYLAGRG